MKCIVSLFGARAHADFLVVMDAHHPPVSGAQHCHYNILTFYTHIHMNIYAHTLIHKKRPTQSYNIWPGGNQELKLIERADFFMLRLKVRGLRWSLHLCHGP